MSSIKRSQNSSGKKVRFSNEKHVKVFELTPWDQDGSSVSDDLPDSSVPTSKKQLIEVETPTENLEATIKKKPRKGFNRSEDTLRELETEPRNRITPKKFEDTVYSKMMCRERKRRAKLDNLRIEVSINAFWFPSDKPTPNFNRKMSDSQSC